MVCYIVPLAALLLTAASRKARSSRAAHGFWLAIMLLGASVFGLVDHAWNGELLIIGTGWANDMALGAAITSGIVAAWGMIVIQQRASHPSLAANKTGIIGRQEGIEM